VKSLSRLLALGLFGLFAFSTFKSIAKTQTAPARTSPASPQQLFQQGESALHLPAILSPYKLDAGKTKGHRVIAMPLCSTGLAPPAFTAPCRNQTSEPAPTIASGMPGAFFGKSSGSA